MVKIALKDGSKIEVEEGTTILDVAKKISEGLARVATCGEVNGEIKDLRYEIQEDSNLVIHTFNEEDLDGKKESKNDAELGKYWASLGDVFVEDACEICNRAKHT